MPTLAAAVKPKRARATVNDSHCIGALWSMGHQTRHAGRCQTRRANQPEPTMNDADRFKLLHGPYHSPRCRIGGKLFCQVRGWVTVRAMSDGRIVWPMTNSKGRG